MYRLELFGEPALRDPGGRALALWRPMTALLALLVRTPDHVVPRERAAGLLWSEGDEAAARRALRQLVFRLREHAPELVEAERARLRLATGRIRVDVIEFTLAAQEGRHRDAMAFYRAPLLADFSLSSSAFGQWLDGEREQLRRAAVTSLAAIVESASEAGKWTDALAHAQRWFDMEPYSDRAAVHVVALQAQLGDRASALATYAEFCRRLDTDLHTAPPHALEQLVERVRCSEAGGSAALAAGGARPTGRAAGELRMVGRATEFGRLSDCWSAAREGVPQFVLLRGEPGIGKTRLATEFSGWVAQLGATTLACRAYEIEAGVPYAALSGALREALRAPGLAGVEARTLVELSRIVPEYATRFPAVAASTEAGLEAGQLRIMDAVRDLLDSLAYEAPVLLLVDDLPWTDAATLATLHYAWRTLAERPLMIVAAARGTTDDELLGAAGLLTAVLREAPARVTTIELGPLPRAAVEEIVRDDLASSEGGSAPSAQHLEARSGGNPLFLSELLRAGIEARSNDAPTDTIRLVTLDRVARLGDDARSLLRAAAVLGRQFPLRVAGAVAALPAPQVADAVDVLLARGLIRQVGYGYDFVHDVVRQTVRDALGEERRRLLHGRAFDEMKPAAATPIDSIRAERAAALAQHAAAAGLRAEANRWYLHTARAAMALYAPAEASRALAGAIENAHSEAEQQATWEAVAQLAHARSDFRGAARAYHAAFRAAREQPERLRLRLRMLHMGARGDVLQQLDVEALADELRSGAEQAGPAAMGELLYILADACARGGDRARAAEYATQAAATLRSATSPRLLVRTLLLHAAVRAADDYDDALSLLDEAEALARRHDLQPEEFDVRIERATELSRLGRWQDALAGLVVIADEATSRGDWNSVAIARLNASDLHMRRGEWAAALEGLAEAQRICERFDFPHVVAVCCLNRAQLEWLRGDAAAAIRHAREARNAAIRAGVAAPGNAAGAIEALALLERGEADAADAALRTETAGRAPHASWSDDTELVVVARARLLAERGEHDAAVELLASASRRTGERYARALLAMEHARLLADRSPAAAITLAREAAESLHALGAVPMAARATELLRKLKRPR